MEISILIFDDLRVERASCDHSKLSKMADQLNGPGCFGPYYSVKIDLEDCDLQQRLATVDVERDRLLEVVKLFYRKHVLNDESIGWDELGDKLYNELSEILGDKEFCKWLDTQSM